MWGGGVVARREGFYLFIFTYPQNLKKCKRDGKNRTIIQFETSEDSPSHQDGREERLTLQLRAGKCCVYVAG